MSNKNQNLTGKQPNSTDKLFKEESIDLRRIFLRYLASWPFFLLFIIISLSGAFIFNRYSTSIYNIKTSVLVRDNSNYMTGAEDFISSLQLLSSTKNIDNEIGIFRSYDLTAKALSKLDFGVGYFSDGNIKDNEIYNNSPYIIEVDSNHLQIINTYFNVEVLNGKKIKVVTDLEDGVVYDISTNTKLTNKTPKGFKNGI